MADKSAGNAIKIEQLSATGQTWTFDIRDVGESTVASSEAGEIGRLSDVAVRALMHAGESASYRARWLMETFDLIVLTSTGTQMEGRVLRGATAKLRHRLALP